MYVCGSLITWLQYFHPYFLIVLASDSTLAWLLSRVLRDIVTLMDSMQTLSAIPNRGKQQASKNYYSEETTTKMYSRMDTELRKDKLT